MVVSGQFHVLAALPIPGKKTPDTHWIGRWMGPTTSMYAAAKTKINPCPVRPPCGPVLYWLNHPGSYVIPVKRSTEVRSEWLLFTHAHTQTYNSWSGVRWNRIIFVCSRMEIVEQHYANSPVCRGCIGHIHQSERTISRHMEWADVWALISKDVTSERKAD